MQVYVLLYFPHTFPFQQISQTVHLVSACQKMEFVGFDENGTTKLCKTTHFNNI